MTDRAALRIPTTLRAVLLGGVTTLACGTGATPLPDDGGKTADRDTTTDASPRFDGGPCTIKVPPGKICETTCIDVGRTSPRPAGCQVYCDPPKEGVPGTCSCNGGFLPEAGGFCPHLFTCELDLLPDGGTDVLC